MTRRGFPHSEIPGSKLVCSSPRLFAADRVLHRLLAPRHSPCALSSLTIGIQELTIDAPFALEAFATVPLPNPHLENTARVLWIRKKLPFAEYSIDKEHRRLPSTIAVTVITANLARVAPARHRAPQSRKLVVENTGLEPVTSWLQTRRSPS